MRTFVHAPGTRVEVRKGAYPMDAALVGRRGVVVELNDYRLGRYGVELDGEEGLRDFAEDELVAVAAEAPPGTRGATGPTVGPTPSGGSGAAT